MPWPRGDVHLASGLRDLARLSDGSRATLLARLLDLLVPLLDLDLAYAAVRDGGALRVAARLTGAADPLPALEGLLAPFLRRDGPTTGGIRHPIGGGPLQVAAARGGGAPQVALVAAAGRAGFPEPLVFGLLALGAAQLSLTIEAGRGPAAAPLGEAAPGQPPLTARAEPATPAGQDEFLAVLAHELRNPLAPLRNGIEVLRRLASVAPGQQHIHDMLERQVAHLARLLDDLLDLAHVRQGQVLLRTEPIDATALVREVLEDHQAALAEKELTLEARMAAEPLWVAGDPTRLTQAVGHLLTNAVEFTPPGGHVRVGLWPDGLRVRLTVSDSGAGVEPALLGRIFEGFHPAAATGDGGLRLGLSLVKALVELHGGTVAAASGGPGSGATFTVWLPHGTAPARPVVAEAGSTRHGRRVLIVEDKADAGDSLRLLLEAFGHQVALAEDGQTGVERAQEFLPDVILCDIGLPKGMDGYAVARALRRDARLSTAYLIAVTGYGQDEDRRRAEEAGFDLHITKPLDPRYLEQVLAALPAPLNR